MTLVSAGRMTHRCVEVATALGQQGTDVEVIDLRYIWPLDTETIGASLARTSKLAVVSEAVEFCGWSGEVAAWAAEHHFEDLDGPIARLGARRSPIPFQPHLEDEVVPTAERITAVLRDLAEY